MRCGSCLTKWKWDEKGSSVIGESLQNEVWYGGEQHLNNESCYKWLWNWPLLSMYNIHKHPFMQKSKKILLWIIMIAVYFIHDRLKNSRVNLNSIGFKQKELSLQTYYLCENDEVFIIWFKTLSKNRFTRSKNELLHNEIEKMMSKWLSLDNLLIVVVSVFKKLLTYTGMIRMIRNVSFAF